MRPHFARRLESAFLDMGYDVRVTLISDNDRHMMILGSPVNRVFIHQLMTPLFRAELREAGFTEVTLGTSWWNPIAVYNVSTDRIQNLD